MDLTQIRTTYNALDQQRKQIELVLLAMGPLLDVHPTLEALQLPASPSIPAAETKEAERETTRAPRDTKPAPARTKTAAPRGRGPAEVTDEHILAVVRRLGSAAPKAIVAELGLAAPVGRYRLSLLVKSGQLVATGTTTTRRLTVAGGGPVAAAPKSQKPDTTTTTPASATPTAPVPGTEDQVKAREEAIRRRLKTGDAKLDELLRVMPDEPGLSDADKRVACMRALRRMTLRNIVIDLGEKFRLVG